MGLVSYNQRGYSGSAMSDRAVSAYDAGKTTWSKLPSMRFASWSLSMVVKVERSDEPRARRVEWMGRIGAPDAF